MSYAQKVYNADVFARNTVSSMCADVEYIVLFNLLVETLTNGEFKLNHDHAVAISNEVLWN